MKRHIAVVLVLGMLPSADLYAQHKTASTQFMVSAAVEEVCEVSASDLVLGNNAGQPRTPLLGTTRLRATCTPNSGYRVGLDRGTTPAAGILTGIVTGVGTGFTQDHTLFGSIPATDVIPADGPKGPATVRIYY